MRKILWKHTLLVPGMLFLLVYTADAQLFGDNLGSHKASQDIDMSNKKVLNAQGMIVGSSFFLNNTSIALQIDAADKALLISRVFDTSAITEPVNGMLVYSDFNDKFYARQAGEWVTFGAFNGSSGVTTLNDSVGSIIIKGDNAGITMSNAGNTWTVKANTSAAIWNAGKLASQSVLGTLPTSGQVLQYNNVKKAWEPASISTLNNLILPNGLQSDSIVTTLNGVLRKISSSNIIYITDTASMLSNLLRVSDTAAMLSNRLKISDTTKMLSGYVRAGNVPATGVTTVSVVSANGISGTVTNPTSTPGITLTLGNITPTSVSASGAISGTTLAGTITTASQPNITLVGTLSGLTVTSSINGSVTGNAATATALQNPRTINGVTFDGSANIIITSVADANTLTGTTLAPNVLNSSLTSVGTLTNLAVTNPITGTITGNAGTATALQTARNINGVSFNGTTDITLLVNANSLTGTTLAPNVVNSSLTSVGTLTGLTVTNPIN
ncbi:MAG: hypothetical protein M0Q26_10325, partial [Chitinophagaceae bacterium]|nr:hypothetical protein [Chitinophagaceae bacterium]